MKKILVLLAVGAIGAGVAAWAAPTPGRAAEANARRGASEAGRGEAGRSGTGRSEAGR